MRLFMVVWILAFAPAAHGGTVLHVDDDAAAGGDGLTWATAFAQLQDALALAALPARGVTEIRVAQGTYRPDSSATEQAGTGDRTVSFTLVNGVALRGGYAGVNQPDPDTRDPDLFPAILSGDLALDDLPDFVNNDENSFHVVDGSGVDDTAILDGFIIRGGNANDSSPNERGAGLLCEFGHPTVIACRFEHNTSINVGGAMSTILGGLDVAQTVSMCTFEGNHADNRGGALYFSGGSGFFDGCTFTANTADEGAGIQAEADDVNVDGCLFTANVASEGGGAINIASGRYFVTGSTFDQNQAPQGGAMNVDLTAGIIDAAITSSVFTDNTGRAVFLDLTSPTITNCIFEDNPDGGLHLASDALGFTMIIGCSFARNTSSFQGAAILSNGSTFVMGGVYESNATSGPGGAIAHQGNEDIVIVGARFFDNTAISAFGGGAYLSNADCATVLNCCFVGNSGERGGGLYAFLPIVDDLTLANCMFSGNFASISGGGLYTDSGNNADMIVANNSFSLNVAGTSGGGSFHRLTGLEDVEMGNGIWWANEDAGGQNEDAQIRFSGGTRPVHFSCIQGLSAIAGDGNIASNPDFVDADGADDVVGTLDDDLRPAPQSPCIDAGDNALVPPDVYDVDNDMDATEPLPTDRDANNRFRDDLGVTDTGSPDPLFPFLPLVDMGAYERQESSPPGNDECDQAALLLSGLPSPFVNFGADTDGFDDTICNLDGAFTRDVWFRHFAVCDGTLVIRLSDVDYDAVVAVYAGFTCPDGPDQAIACFAWPDDSVTVPTSPGAGYRIRVGGLNGAEGAGTLTVTCSPAGSCVEDCAVPQNGAVDIVDLLAMLAQWGGPGTCDVAGDDDAVTINDLLALLAAWGVCVE